MTRKKKGMGKPPEFGKAEGLGRNELCGWSTKVLCNQLTDDSA